MRVSQKVVEELRRNNKLKGLLAIEHGCTVYTIERWIRVLDVKHLTAAVTLHIDIIKRETGLSNDDILVADDHNSIT